MKILVPVKRVVDYNVKIRVDKETNAEIGRASCRERV